MNAWDVATWFASVALALAACGIFGFFARDARSILSRSMHDDPEFEDDPSASGTTARSVPTDAPEDLPR